MMKLAVDGQRTGPPPVGLYIHVPFCTGRCGYCDFYSLEAPRGIPEGYEASVLDEARLHAEHEPISVDTVYLGGGTPSLLEPERLDLLLSGLRTIFNVLPDSEVTLEANPETVTSEALSNWMNSGITRLSIGVQSLDEAVLKVLDRRASPETALGAVEMALSAGFRHISADLMLGVPGQNLVSLRGDLDTLAIRPIDHVSVYGLDLHPGTRLYEAVLSGATKLPDEDETADMFETVHERLTTWGFDHYEISNFARSGARCRHNLKYWKGGETIGLGPSAWSRFRGRLAGNVRDLGVWADSVRRGELPNETVEILTESRRRQDRLIFGLRVSDGVDLETVRDVLSEGGRDPEQMIASLTAHGYAAVEDGHLFLTPLGFLTSNEVLTYLLPDHFRGLSP